MYKPNWTAALRKAFAASAAVAGITTMIIASSGTANAQDAPPSPPPGSGAQGQGGRGPGGPGMGGGMALGLPHSGQLVNRPDVSKDLALTQDQRDQIREIMDKAREKMRSLMPPPPGEGGDDQAERPDPETMRAKMDKAQSEIDSAIAKVLTTNQVQRLKEIKIQIAGSSAAIDKDIQSQLGLTADQKSQIDALAKAQRAKMGRGPGGFGGPGGPGGPGGGPGGDGGFGGPPPGQGGQGGPPGGGQGGDGGFGGPPPGGGQGGPGGPGGFGGPGGPGGPGGQNPQAEKARKELNTAIDSILTSDQKAALKKLGGTKVFVQQQRPQGGRGQGQGGPGGGGGFGGGN